MKKITLLLSAVILIFLFAFTASTHSGGGMTGLYMTRDDFFQHKLSYSHESGPGNNRFMLHGLFGSSTFDLVSDGKKQAFSKKEVYGFRDNDQMDYRFFENNAYRILDTAGFFLYDYNKLVQGDKIARPQTLAYFSVKADGPVLELTLDNLQKAFSGNARFRYLVNAQFKTDRDLIAYDHALNTYLLKYLYGQASNSETSK